MTMKGMAIGDATFRCPDEIPSHWPNSGNAPLKAFRLFRASQPGWDDSRSTEFATKLSEFVGYWSERRSHATRLRTTKISDT
mmetsp:Transcript_62801/g.204985  ORF Transcript_62801/g.204985 Transcript_62801/m.204985 type:complete len:82 (+) Transcript_62801:161-406(+)